MQTHTQYHANMSTVSGREKTRQYRRKPPPTTPFLPLLRMAPSRWYTYDLTLTNAASKNSVSEILAPSISAVEPLGDAVLKNESSRSCLDNVFSGFQPHTIIVLPNVRPVRRSLFCDRGSSKLLPSYSTFGGKGIHLSQMVDRVSEYHLWTFPYHLYIDCGIKLSIRSTWAFGD